MTLLSEMETMECSLVRKGVRLAWWQRGSGPPAVLVHGLGLTGRDWLGLDDHLIRAGFTVVMTDNRGAGDSSVPAPPYRMGDLVDDLAAILHVVGGGPAVVLGFSLGGMIAQEFALRYPEHVAGLVLAATWSGLPLGRPPSVATLAVLLQSMALPGWLERMGPLLVHPDNLKRNPRILDPVYKALRSVRLASRTVALPGLLGVAALHTAGFTLRRLRCPVEVIAGPGWWCWSSRCGTDSSGGGLWPADGGPAPA